jgi:hypothetical protein
LRKLTLQQIDCCGRHHRAAVQAGGLCGSALWLTNLQALVSVTRLHRGHDDPGEPTGAGSASSAPADDDSVPSDDTVPAPRSVGADLEVDKVTRLPSSEEEDEDQEADRGFGQAEHEKYADLYIEWRPAPTSSRQWVFSATKYGKIGARTHPV